MYYILNIDKQSDIETYQQSLPVDHFFVVTASFKTVQSFNTNIITYNNLPVLEGQEENLYRNKTSYTTTRPVFVIETNVDAYIESIAEYTTENSLSVFNNYLNIPDINV